MQARSGRHEKGMPRMVLERGHRQVRFAYWELAVSSAIFAAAPINRRTSTERVARSTFRTKGRKQLASSKRLQQ